MEKKAFDAFNHILVMVIAKQEAFEKYSHTESEAIRRQYAALVSELKSKAQQYLDAIHDTLEDWGIVAYLPPESCGALIALIDTAMSDPEVAADFLYRDKAAFIVAEILVTQQTPRQLEETLLRITPNIGQKTNHTVAEVTDRTLTEGKPYSGCFDRCRVAIADTRPALGKPFLRNDEPTFITTIFPVNDPAYRIG